MKKGVILLLLLIGFVVLAPMNAIAQEGVTITFVDDDAKSVKPNENTTYTWLAENMGTDNHTIFVSVSTTNTEWSASVNSPSFVLHGGESQNVVLTVVAPSESKEALRTIVTFLVTTDSEQVFSETKTVTTDLVKEQLVFGMFSNPLPPPLDNYVGVFLLTVLIWVAIALVVFFVLDPIVKSFTKKTKTEIDDIVLAIIKTPVFVLVFTMGAVSSLKILPLPGEVISWIERIYGVIVALIITWLAYKIFRDVMMYIAKRYSEKTKTNLDDILVPILEKVGVVVIFIIGFIYIIGSFGYDITVFVAGMGIMGLIIAFAAQDSLSNFFAGFHILMDRPFKVGDMLLLENGDYCRVKDIGLRSTKLYNTFAHDIVIMPNNMLASQKIVNLTEPDVKFRVKIEIGVAYDSDVDKVKEILSEAANKEPEVIQEEGYKPYVRLIEFGDSALMFKVYTWVDDVSNQWKVAANIRETVLKRFREEGIEIPFPQRVVWMRDEREESQS